MDDAPSLLTPLFERASEQERLHVLVPVVFKELPVNDPMQRQPDISKAKEILDWEPKVMRAEGLERTYAWFKNLPVDRLYRKEHRDFEDYKIN